MFGIPTRRAKASKTAPRLTENFEGFVEARLAPLHLMDEGDVLPTVESIVAQAETLEDRAKALHLAAQAIISARQELAGLRDGVHMMGINPERLAEASRSREIVYPSILLGCVAPDREALKARCGESTNLAGWMKMWERLKS